MKILTVFIFMLSLGLVFGGCGKLGPTPEEIAKETGELYLNSILEGSDHFWDTSMGKMKEFFNKSSSGGYLALVWHNFTRPNVNTLSVLSASETESECKYLGANDMWFVIHFAKVEDKWMATNYEVVD